MNRSFKLNKEKLERQQIGVERWYNSSLYGAHKDRNGCINYCTGVGKSYTAMLIMKRYFIEYDNPSIFIICPAHLITQWKNTLDEHFYKKEITNVYVYSPEYLLNKGIIAHPHLLIVDELDAFYSEERFKLIDKTQIIYRDLLALTATYEDVNNRHLKVKTFCPVIDKIGEKEALAKKYISKYIEYNLGLDFTQEEKKEHERLSTLIREGLSKFGKGSLPLAMKCISGGKTKDGEKHTSTEYCYNWAKYNGWKEHLNLNNPSDRELHDLWNPRTIFGYAINLMRCIKNRKELIYMASNKLAATVEILENFKYTKGIVFSQSTVFADLLYGIVNEIQPDNSVIFHSKIQTQMLPSPKTGKLMKFGKVRLKKRAMERINNNLSNHLITSSVLDKGLDIPSIKFGITTSGTQNPTQYIQRKGRPTRLNEQDKEGVVILVNLYIKNSKEVTWLKNRQAEADNIIYWIDSTDEVSYKPQMKEKGINIKDI